MEKIIRHIKITNYKRFKSFSLELKNKVKLIVGDNESGKSTILSAIDLVLSGSTNKVQNIGLEKIFNVDTIQDFLEGEKDYSKLPILQIELFLNDIGNQYVEGENNSERINACGIKLICEPNEVLKPQIKEILERHENNFPFEFYKIRFKTFQGRDYFPQSNYISHILIDNAEINYSYAYKKYIVGNYRSWLENSEENVHENEYRRAKQKYNNDILRSLNDRITENYSFATKTDKSSNLESDLTILEEGISIENKGKGRQCFVKTDFALQQRVKPLDVVLIEEPENHLSHTNMKKLISKIKQAQNTQLIIATHSDLICSRLDLRNAILLNSNSQEKLRLDELDEQTAKFFIKSPTNNILEFILSKKVILVEGDAEFILLEQFFENVAGYKVEDSEVHVISVGGTSFPRFLKVAKILGIKTAVICDNDSNYQANCIERFSDFDSNHNIEIFYLDDNSISTFELSVFRENEDVCNELFLQGRRTLTVAEYMLSNKSEAAFQLLYRKSNELNTPNYIKRAIEWISQ